MALINIVPTVLLVVVIGVLALVAMLVPTSRQRLALRMITTLGELTATINGGGSRSRSVAVPRGRTKAVK